MARLRQDQIRELVGVYFKAQLKQYLEWLNNRGFSANTLEDMRCEEFDHALSIDQESSYPRYLPKARFMRKMDVSEADWDDSQPRIVQELHRGRRDMLRAVLEAAEGVNAYALTATPEMVSSRPQPLSAPLGEAVDDFMSEHSRNWPEKTTRQVRSYLNILIEYFGPDRRLEEITKRDASDIQRLMQSLPARRNVKPELKKLALRDVIKVTGHERVSPKTINSHIDTYRRFFDWAERHDKSPHKLFVGLKVPKARDSATVRKPFNTTQTRQLFAELTTNTSGLVRNDSHKWGTLLGLFTGARLNEICQLDIADVKQENDIWFLNITDEGGDNKSVKASASRRKVPLHSELIRLGFLDFVGSRSRHDRLFPDYSFYPNGGFGRTLGRWVNESFLPKLEMKEPGLVFHSFRHTVVTRLGQAGVAEPVIQHLVGHAREGVTQEVYFRDGYSLNQLKEAVECFTIS